MFSRRTNWNLSPNRYTSVLEEHRRAHRELLDLTASNPTTIGLRYDETLLKSFMNPAALRYAPDPRGMRSAREAVSAYYQARDESVSPDNVILTTSTSEAYSFVFRLLCDHADQVLIPSPGYPLFDFLADLHDVRLKPYGLFYDQGWHVDLHTVEQNADETTRAIVCVHPNNPTGSFVHEREVAHLNAVCRDREMALIVDEVFLDFAHDLGHRASFAVNDEALTFTLSGISKIAGLPQMKLAWIVVSGPDELVKPALERLEVIADTFLSMNTPTQLAAPAMLGSRESFQRQLMTRVRANVVELDAQLSRQSLAQRLEIEGGWYAVLRVPVRASDEDLAITLLQEESVLVHPGHFYEFPSDGYLVVSLITPEPEFRDGLSRVLSYLSG